MLSYWLKRRKNTESKNPGVVKAKNGRKIVLTNCGVRDSKKSKFIKEQQVIRPLIMISKTPLLGKLY